MRTSCVYLGWMVLLMAWTSEAQTQASPISERVSTFRGNFGVKPDATLKPEMGGVTELSTPPSTSVQNSSWQPKTQGLCLCKCPCQQTTPNNNPDAKNRTANPALVTQSCCFDFIDFQIPGKRIVSAVRTSSHCPVAGVVVKTLKTEFCVKADEAWIKKYL